MVTIRRNLGVLATFTGRPGLSGKGARKLHINTATGEFSTKDGLYQNIFQRSADDSLLNTDTIKTLNDMFQHAIKNIHSDNYIEITRKALFDGFRGLVYLAYNGYKNKHGYDALDKMIKGITKSLEYLLEKFVVSAKVDHNVFVTGLNTNKTQFFIQKDFLPTVEGGICWGICMDWCRRVLVKRKFSFGTSSKSLFEDVKNELRDKGVKKLREINRDINRSPNFTSDDMRRAEFARQQAVVNGDFSEILNVNQNLINAARYQKKGTYAALAQHTQTLRNYKDVSASIGDLMNHRNKLAETLKKDYETKTVKDEILGTVLKNVPLTEKKKKELNQEINEIDNALNKIKETNISGQDPLEIASNKFSRMRITSKNRTDILPPEVLFMSDQSDFTPHLTILINRCLNPNSSDAFFLSWKCSTSYCGIGGQSAHAMAFAMDPAVQKYYAMDPNCGEFSSDSIDGLIFIFSVILSRYSFGNIINSLETKTLILEPSP